MITFVFFKNLKHLKIANSLWLLERKKQAQICHTLHFFHTPTVRKYECFIHFCLAEQFRHPILMKQDHCALYILPFLGYNKKKLAQTVLDTAQ